jgi:hypothetical protein
VLILTLVCTDLPTALSTTAADPPAGPTIPYVSQAASAQCEEGEVVVEEEVVVDFNVTPPLCVGPSALCELVAFDTREATPVTWTARFEVGPRRLVLRAPLTVRNVPRDTNSQQSPGLELRSQCGITVAQGATIELSPRNQPGGSYGWRPGGTSCWRALCAVPSRGPKG